MNEFHRRYSNKSRQAQQRTRLRLIFIRYLNLSASTAIDSAEKPGQSRANRNISHLVQQHAFLLGVLDHFCMRILFFYSAGTSLFEGGGNVTSVTATQACNTKSAYLPNWDYGLPSQLGLAPTGLGVPHRYSFPARQFLLRLNLFVTHHH